MELLTEHKKKLAEKLISYFENSTTVLQYEYAKNIQDNRGFTCGRAGFTTGTGDALKVIEVYTQKVPANNLTQYIGELRRLKQVFADHGYQINEKTGDTSNLQGFAEEWKNAAKNQAFRDAQDEVVDQSYYKPSQQRGNAYGLKYPLSGVVLYDTMIQHGESGIDDLLEKTPKPGDEKQWLKIFLEQRKEVLKSNNVWAQSVGRCDALLEIANQGNYDFNPPIEFVMPYPNVAPKDRPKVSFDENTDFQNPYS